MLVFRPKTTWAGFTVGMVKGLGFRYMSLKSNGGQISQSIYCFSRKALQKWNSAKKTECKSVECPFNMSETASKVMLCAYSFTNVHFPSNILLLLVIFFFCLTQVGKLYIEDRHFIWYLWNEPSASFINFTWNDHECKILFIIWLFKMGFYRL